MQLSISYRQILAIAFPLMLSNFFQHFIGVIDTAFMGRISEPALAACGLTALFYFIVWMIPFGFSIGSQIIIARRAGELKYDAIGEVFDNVLYLLSLLCIFLFFFLKLIAPFLLKQLIQSEEIYQQSILYLNYRSYEMLLGPLIFSLTSFYTGLGRTFIIIVSTFTMVVVNIFFNYSLVFGEFGFPRMEIAGAGLASLFSSLAALLVLLLHVFLSGYAKTYKIFLFPKWEKSVIQRVLTLSGPIVLQMLTGMSVWFVFFLLIEKMGALELAISNVVKEIYLLFSITSWGLGNATNTLVSNLIGQGALDKVYLLIKKVVGISLVFAILGIITISLFTDEFIRIFTNDPMVVTEGRGPLLVASSSLILMSITAILYRAVTGTGATAFMFKAELFCVSIYLIYVVILVPVLKVNLSLAWTSEYLYWSTMGVICFAYLRSGRWKKLTV